MEQMSDISKEVAVEDVELGVIGQKTCSMEGGAQPSLEVPRTPVIVFVNTRSGGQKGSKLFNPLKEVFGAERTFDMFEKPIGPKKGLEKFVKEEGVRVLIAGGDGTVNWVLETVAMMMEEDDTVKWPPVAILPLGTGNDLSRQFNWGHAFLGQNKDLARLREAILTAEVKQLDRWKLQVQRIRDESTDVGDAGVEKAGEEEASDWSKTFINYFGMGVDGRVVALFEECRTAYPWLFCCRCMNNAIYGWFGATFCCRQKHQLGAGDFVLELDGAALAIPKNSQGLQILNIQSFMGGVELWQHPEKKADPSDGNLSVCSVNGALHLGTIKLNAGTAHALSQSDDVLIRCPKKTSFPVPAQIDGEALVLPTPGTYQITKLPQASMLQGPISDAPACDFCC